VTLFLAGTFVKGIPVLDTYAQKNIFQAARKNRRSDFFIPLSV
jgi:hypothetical protein